LQEQDNVINSLAGGNVSARTRRNIDTEYKAGDSNNISYKVSCNQNFYSVRITSFSGLA
jgi:hypothetical protein